MAYTITPTNGQNPIVIADGTINTSTTITLVGKNYPNYGNILDQNLIKLLENSANTSAPYSPITGELWWDSGNRNLNVYTGSAWKTLGSTTTGATAPTSNNNVGDLWWNTSTGTLWGYDNITQEYKLVGPIGGLADIETETLNDGSSNHICLTFKINGVRYMIFSIDAAFSPSPSIDGFQTIYPGLNLVSSAFLANAKFIGITQDSVTLDGLYPNSFVRADQNSSTIGTLSILNNNGLNVGTANQLNLSVLNPNVAITNQTSLGYMNFNVYNGSGQQLDAVDIYPNGNLVCNYDLTVKGQVHFNGSGDLLISTTTPSYDTLSGALQVRGGTGIVGNLNVGGSYNNYVGQLRAQSIVSNSSVNGTTVTASNLVGNIVTPAQGNITSVGTLTGLTCIGTANFNNILMSGTTTLGGAPTASLHATTKAYVDSAIAAGIGGIQFPSVPGVNGTANQVAVFNGSNSVVGSSGLTYTSGSGLVVSALSSLGPINGIQGANLTGSLAVTGTISSTGDITAFASDIRLKTNIENITNALDKVDALVGFTYNWNDLAASMGYNTNERLVGVSAQDVQKVLPEAVKPAPVNKEYLTVQYEKIVPLLIEAIKELRLAVDNLSKK